MPEFCGSCGTQIEVIGGITYRPVHPGPADGIPCPMCGARRRRDRIDRLQQDSDELETTQAALRAAQVEAAVLRKFIEGIASDDDKRNSCAFSDGLPGCAYSNDAKAALSATPLAAATVQVVETANAFRSADGTYWRCIHELGIFDDQTYAALAAYEREKGNLIASVDALHAAQGKGSA